LGEENHAQHKEDVLKKEKEPCATQGLLNMHAPTPDLNLSLSPSRNMCNPGMKSGCAKVPTMQNTMVMFGHAILNASDINGSPLELSNWRCTGLSSGQAALYSVFLSGRAGDHNDKLSTQTSAWTRAASRGSKSGSKAS